jgi:septum formation protein
MKRPSHSKDTDPIYFPIEGIHDSAFMGNSLPSIILASQSPRRKELLSADGWTFDCISLDTPERSDPNLSPDQLCCLNAWLKAEAVSKLHPETTVIGADTLVFLDGTPMGKPSDLDEARSMLRNLSGREHIVCTGVAILSPLGLANWSVITKVQFKELSEQVISDYISVVPVLDKAGSYAFQDHGEMIISSIEGDADNVIGLPVKTVRNQLISWGYSHPLS